MTLAPELPGYAEVSALLRDAGVLVALGHSDAGHQVFADELSRLEGRGLVTHVGNAMPPLHHRAAGPVAASLSAATRGEGLVELIADGVHTDAGFVDLVFATAAPGCVVLVTDAMAAAGMPDGRYALGGQDVTVVDRVARLSESAAQGGSIAGGTAHLVEVVATCGPGSPWPTRYAPHRSPRPACSASTLIVVSWPRGPWPTYSWSTSTCVCSASCGRGRGWRHRRRE
jgi:N-acetylglucosamine-6-phosphate deacetylase